MVVDELIYGDNPEDDLYNVEGTINPQGEGGNVEDTVMEEENKGNQIPIPDNDEAFEGREVDTVEGQGQNQTLDTPTIAVIPTGGVSTSSIGGLSAERLVILRRSQPLEYLTAMLSCRESSSEKSLSIASVSGDQPSSTPTDEVLSKIKDKIFKGDLLLLLLVDPSAPLTLKALLNQVDLLETSPEVANVILEIGTMIDQAAADPKLLPQLIGEIKKKFGSEAVAWDVATESTNKAMELEQTKQKKKEKIEGHDRDIASWSKQIE